MDEEDSKRGSASKGEAGVEERRPARSSTQPCHERRSADLRYTAQPAPLQSVFEFARARFDAAMGKIVMRRGCQGKERRDLSLRGRELRSEGPHVVHCICSLS